LLLFILAVLIQFSMYDPEQEAKEEAEEEARKKKEEEENANNVKD